jgi:hypothetical protein
MRVSEFGEPDTVRFACAPRRESGDGGYAQRDGTDQ